MNKLQTNHSLQSPESKEDIYVNKKKIVHSEEDADPSFAEERETKEVFDRRKNHTTDSNPVYDKQPKWPTFDNEEPESPVKFVNNTRSAGDGQKYQGQGQNKSTKITYPKNFSYHRVTGG